MIINTEAIILRAIRYGDTSKIVTAFTRDHGRVSVIAKGALGAKPRFGAALEPMAHCSIVYYQKDSRDLQMLSQADAVDTFRGIQSDGARLIVGFAIVEYAYAAIHAGEQHRELFTLLVRSLRGLDAARKNASNLLLRFLVDFCGELGFALDTGHCVNCRIDMHEERAVTDKVLLAVHEGAFACSTCGQSVTGIAVPGQVFKGIQWIREAGQEQLTTLSMGPGASRDALRILHHYIASHIQDLRSIRSLEMLDVMS